MKPPQFISGVVTVLRTTGETATQLFRALVKLPQFISGVVTALQSTGETTTVYFWCYNSSSEHW